MNFDLNKVTAPQILAELWDENTNARNAVIAFESAVAAYKGANAGEIAAAFQNVYARWETEMQLASASFARGMTSGMQIIGDMVKADRNGALIVSGG